MRKVFIIYVSFFDKAGDKLTIGGIQTYIRELCSLIIEMKMQPIILQYADRDFYREFEGVHVYGLKKKRMVNRKKQVIKFCETMGDTINDILIFASDVMVKKNAFKNNLCIQHGITWDIPIDMRFDCKSIYNILNKKRKQLCVVSRIKKCSNVVCVDYNFLNWYRTKVINVANKITVIPNFSHVEEIGKVSHKEIRIIFARRMFFYRGTYIFADAVEKVLLDLPDYNIEVIFAGDGPDKEMLEKRFEKYNNVKFIRYDSKDSIEIHKTCDIAVVPTLGSEGTSLSLLEAMAAKCAVIATNVGGMTNIIIDSYNGFLVNPEPREIESAIKKLVLNEKMRLNMGNKAYETVLRGFSAEKWRNSWREVLLLFGT